MVKLLSIFGTRPEAIKMAPVIRSLDEAPNIDSLVCVTAQHRAMLDQVLSLFEIEPYADLDVMKADQDIAHITTAVLNGVGGVLDDVKPDRVLVHGDTTTTLAAALAAYYRQIPIAHVEAGLRTGDRYAPFPEEMNRKLTDDLADLHFAPTESARDNLLQENVPAERIHVTGNTVIDALHDAVHRIENDQTIQKTIRNNLPKLDESKHLILVTGHRRENFGTGFENICKALANLSERDDLQIVYPVHLNPNVKEPVDRLLGKRPSILLIDPLDYLPFVYLMKKAHIIITDSGGIQEEAPSLGKPVLVMRDVTERPEAVEAGTVKLVGTDAQVIAGTAGELLDNNDLYDAMSQAQNPYGDGKASERIRDVILKDH
jgi:UDP-N-acetylglucosamine 2-epimerase (non-hydrolysing)